MCQKQVKQMPTTYKTGSRPLGLTFCDGLKFAVISLVLPAATALCTMMSWNSVGPRALRVVLCTVYVTPVHVQRAISMPDERLEAANCRRLRHIASQEDSSAFASTSASTTTAIGIRTPFALLSPCFTGVSPIALSRSRADSTLELKSKHISRNFETCLRPFRSRFFMSTKKPSACLNRLRHCCVSSVQNGGTSCRCLIGREHRLYTIWVHSAIEILSDVENSVLARADCGYWKPA